MIILIDLPDTLPQAKEIEAKYEKYGFIVQFIV